MKKFLLTIVVALTVFFAFAQHTNRKINYSLGADFASPIGNFHIVAGLGLGISAEADYKVSTHISLTGNVGFISYKGRDYSVYVDRVLYSAQLISVTQIPVMAGAKFFFGKKIYASGQSGVSFFHNNGGQMFNNVVNSSPIFHYYVANKTAFTTAFGLGTKLGNHFDIALNYFFAAETRSLASPLLKIAYVF